MDDIHQKGFKKGKNRRIAFRVMHNASHHTELQATTSWRTAAGFNRRLLSALMHGDEAKAGVAARILREDAGEARWDEISSGRKSLGVKELERILRGMEKKGYRVNTESLSYGHEETLFGQQAFYDAMARNIQTAEKIRDQLEAISAEGKKNKGYASAIFNIVSHRNPVEKAMESVVELERYTRRNGIVYDEASQSLIAGKKPKTFADRVVDFRFLAAAGAGGAVGYLGGFNLAAAAPGLGLVSGAFLGGLPYLALPFITLSIFKAFSEKSLLKEAGTLGRFAGVMATGFAISFGMVSAMSGILPVIDPASIAAGGGNLITSMAQSFSPSQYILHGIGGGAVLGSLYRAAKMKMADGFQQGANAGKGALKKAFDAASNLVVNRKTVPVINAIGSLGDKAANAVDKTFGHYMNWLGIPAVVIMMSGTLSGGIGGLAAYGAYYATVMAGMATTAVGLAGLARFRYGLGKSGFAALSKIAATAFGTSSSAATMPETKSNLRKIGVPDHIVNSVVPLGANFNMLGTSLYLGATAAVAMAMFGMPLTLPLLAKVGAVTVLTAFGAPGMPSSNIILLDPVLQKTGLDQAQTQKIYKMVLPMDRIFDMSQTVLNVMGDALVALDVWRGEKKRAAAGHEGKKWGQRLREKLAGRKGKSPRPPAGPAIKPGI